MATHTLKALPKQFGNHCFRNNVLPRTKTLSTSTDSTSSLCLSLKISVNSFISCFHVEPGGKEKTKYSHLVACLAGVLNSQIPSQGSPAESPARNVLDEYLSLKQDLQPWKKEDRLSQRPPRSQHTQAFIHSQVVYFLSIFEKHNPGCRADWGPRGWSSSLGLWLH